MRRARLCAALLGLAWLALPVVGQETVPEPAPALPPAAGAAWSAAAQDRSLSLSLGQPAFVWIERLRQSGAPITTFAGTNSVGSQFAFEAGLLAPGSYVFRPAGNFDAASSWRVRSRPMADGGRAGHTPDTAMTLAANQPVRLSPGEAPVWFAVDIPDAGFAQLQTLAGSLAQQPRWHNRDGKAIGSAQALSFYGPRKVYIPVQASADDTIVVVRFTANRDALEPNDSQALAAPVVAGRWYRITSASGDADWVEVNLAKPAQLTLSTRGLAPGQAPAIASVDGKPMESYPLRLKSGKHRISIAAGNVPANEPYLVRLEAAEPVSRIEAGKPVILAASALPATYEFAFEARGPRRLEAWASGTPEGAELQWTVVDDETELTAGNGVSMYLPGGDYTMRVRVPAVPEPARIRFTMAEREAADEPNDSREQAIALDVPSVLAADFGFAGDVDWYRLSVDEAGILRIRQPEGAMRAAADIALALYPVDSEEEVRGFGNDPALLDQTFAVGPGKYELRMTRRNAHGYNPVLLEVGLDEPGARGDSTAGGLGVALVGFGVQSGDGNWMETLARDTSIEFIQAGEVEDLGEALANSLEKKEEAISSPLSPWIVALLLFVVLGGAAFEIRRRHNQTPGGGA